MTERVILVDDDGVVTGTAAKATVHHGATPLHLAFSCYVFDSAGRLLLTRRAATKKTWPGVWTNSVCGHPLPGEDIGDSVRRRAKDELGVTLSALTLILPAFRYRAVMPDGVVENELCPVFRATSTDPPAPDPAEVDDIAWPDWSVFADEVLAGVRDVSPWCRLQVGELAGLGRPVDWPAGDPYLLPAAAIGQRPARSGRMRHDF